MKTAAERRAAASQFVAVLGGTRSDTTRETTTARELAAVFATRTSANSRAEDRGRRRRLVHWHRFTPESLVRAPAAAVVAACGVPYGPRDYMAARWAKSRCSARAILTHSESCKNQLHSALDTS